ncbi:hypothetical protein PAECIP111802_02418 [Paenibacillus allorhizosphaerae]|uniref:Uncharacterized protein n=1 Tax=Paenibacillus allorhizosphaerae TaxID=2849866 RepID=A0ABN7TLY9_9BACL|nr:hypothetical protein PAECIP111802_02418 [Paenibacillus allorhizosphaerae]
MYDYLLLPNKKVRFTFFLATGTSFSLRTIELLHKGQAGAASVMNSSRTQAMQSFSTHSQIRICCVGCSNVDVGVSTSFPPGGFLFWQYDHGRSCLDDVLL